MEQALGQPPPCGYEDRIEAYWDGELVPHERAAVEAHLVTCGTCQARLRALRDLSAALAVYSVPSVLRSSDAAFWQRLAARLPARSVAAERAPRGRWLPLLVPLGLALSAMLVMTLQPIASLIVLLMQRGLLPVPRAAAAVTLKWLVGPALWGVGASLLQDLPRSVPMALPGAHVLDWAIPLASLLLLMPLAALYAGWIVYWMRGINRIDGGQRTS